MAEIATGYITVIPSMEGCQTAIESALGGVDTTSIGKSYGSNLSDGVESMFAGIGSKIMSTLGSAVSAAISVVTDSIDDAISRVDTLNQFPKIMENLGYSADDAAASLDKMSDSIQGLPTTLDDIVSNVTSLAAVTGDLDYATDITIAMNDAMLMFGASTDGVSSGITQLSQMLAKGTVDMQSWNVINSAAPGLLDKVAQAMLGEAATSTTLYTALQDGTISLDEFCDELIYLDKNGTDSMASFSQGVQDATGGIETSFTNISTAVTRNVAKVITELDSEEGYFSQFSTICIDAINALGDRAAVVAGDIVDSFERMYETWKETGSIAESLCSAFDKTDSSMTELSNSTIEMSTALTALPATVLIVITSFESMIKVMEKKLLTMTKCNSMYELMGQSLKLMCNPVNLVVTAITALVAIFAVCWNSSEDFQDSIKGIVSSIGDSLQPVLDTLSEVLADVGESLMPVVNEMFDILVDVFGELFIVAGNVLEALMPIVSDVLQVAIPLVGDLIELLMTMLLPVLESLETVLDFVFTLVDAGFELLDILISACLKPIEGILEILTPAINLLSDALQIEYTIIGAILEILIDFLTFNWADIPNVISETSEKICGITTDMANTITGNTEAVDEAVDELGDTCVKTADSMVEAMNWSSSEVETTAAQWTESTITVRNGVTETTSQIIDECGNVVDVVTETANEVEMAVMHSANMSEETVNATNAALEIALAENADVVEEELNKIEEKTRTTTMVWEDDVNQMVYTATYYADGTLKEFEAVQWGASDLDDELYRVMASITETEKGQYEIQQQIFDDEEADITDLEHANEVLGKTINECSAGQIADWQHATDSMLDDYYNLQEGIEYLADKTGIECDEISAMVDALGGSINNTFTDADHKLTREGELIMQSLGDGMADKWNNQIAPWIASLNEQIPNLKGPESRDKNMLFDAGEWIIGGLGEGMLDEWDDVEDILDDMTEELSSFGDNIEPYQLELVDTNVQAYDEINKDLQASALAIDSSDITDDGEPIYISIENMEVRSDDDIEAVSRELYRLIRRKGAMAA